MDFPRIKRLPPYVFNVVGDLKLAARRRGEDIVDFSMGNPDGASPPHVVEKLIEAVRKPANHRYSVSRGIYKLRVAVCDWYQRRFAVDLDPDAEAIVTMGSKEGIGHLALAMLGPGDVVLCPSPTYPIHQYSVIIAGGDLRTIPLLPGTDFLASLQDAVRTTWPKPKALIINFPHNPTTEVVELDFFRGIVAFAREHECLVVHDLAYADLCFDGYVAPSFLQVPGAKDVGVEFFTLTKSYNMPGWRFGFLVGYREIVGAWARAQGPRQRRVSVAAPVKVGLIGFGTIGAGVVKVLRAHRAEIARRAGRPIDVVAIADLDTTTDRGIPAAPARLTNDARSVIEDPDIPIVIELIGGYEPARRFVLAAIRAGKDVVTANKALLAVHGEEIVAAAEKHGVRLAFEASVGGGIPILRTLKEGLAGDRTVAVYGIVNGTCNHILTTMTREGRSFVDVLAEAQRLGLAEADPSTDIDGIDSAHKLALLTTLAFGVVPRFERIPREGIRRIEAVDIAFARELGYTIKLLAIARDGREAVEAHVQPTMIPHGHLLADVGGNFSAIFVRGAALGPTMYYGQGAGALPTATAAVAVRWRSGSRRGWWDARLRRSRERRRRLACWP